MSRHYRSYLEESGAPSIITSGLILNLDAGNPLSYPGSGTAWNDLSGNGNNATLINGVTYSSSNGGILNLDGTNDKVTFNFGNMINLIPNRPNSVSMWIKFNNTNSRTSLFADWNSSGGLQTSVLELNGSSSTTMKISGSLTSGGYPGLLVPQSINYISSNSWYYVTIQNSTATNTQLFINGVFQDEKTTALSTYVGNGNLSLGSGGDYPAFFLNGSISAFQVYNTSLNQTQITNNFNAYKTRYGL